MIAVTLLRRILTWRSRRIDALRLAWARPKDQPRNLPAIASFHEAQAAAGVPTLDPHTRQDLDLDGVFAALDRTESPIGQQVLYHRLHSGKTTDDDLAAFDRLVTRLGEDAALREQCQLQLGQLRNPSSRDVWTLTEPNVLPATEWYRVFPVLALVTLVAIVALPFWHPALLILLMNTVISIALRVTIASWLLVVAGPFRQIGPILSVAERLSLLVPRELSPALTQLPNDVHALGHLRRIASLAKRDTGAAGDLGGIVMEYLNLVLYLDGNALLFGRRELDRHRDALARVLTTIGTIDAAIAVASWRAEHTNWCTPEHRADALTVEGMWHPLVTAPVANTVAIPSGRGLIVTGSNMSGKTTYLRTLGVAVIMAQTIRTCPAARYSGPTLDIRTSIGRNDSLEEGKSYYLAEAEAVLACVRATGGANACLFLFDELFRGTNLVERLAAGEAVLRALVGDGTPHVAIVATHDGELVDLVADCYQPVHFDGRLSDGVLQFDYHVRPGPATSRNAIALLQQLGAPSTLIAQATARAAELDIRGTRPDNLTPQ